MTLTYEDYFKTKAVIPTFQPREDTRKRIKLRLLIGRLVGSTNLPPGSEIELPEDDAKVWIARGMAEDLTPKEEPADRIDRIPEVPKPVKMEKALAPQAKRKAVTI